MGEGKSFFEQYPPLSTGARALYGELRSRADEAGPGELFLTVRVTYGQLATSTGASRDEVRALMHELMEWRLISKDHGHRPYHEPQYTIFPIDA